MSEKEDEKKKEERKKNTIENLTSTNVGFEENVF